MFQPRPRRRRPQSRAVPFLVLLAPLLAGSSLALARGAPAGEAASNDGPAEEDPAPQHPSGDRETVTPGECFTNGDGVEVCSTKKRAHVTPRDGDAQSATQVDSQTGFEGSVSGLDANDTVNLASHNTVTIEGDGGTVLASGSSTLTVTNGTARGTLMIELQNGNQIYVPPGTEGLRIQT